MFAQPLEPQLGNVSDRKLRNQVMINVGVAGLGMMGSTHLDAYANLDGARVVAVADLDEAKRTGRQVAGGNIEGQSSGSFDYSKVKQYANASELIADPDVQLVDICLPTPDHVQYAIDALRAGKDVLVEKPLARTSEEAKRLAREAANAKGFAMCAMCMRFWPGWDWLKEAVQTQCYGRTLAANFRRVSSHPGGPFYHDGSQCGGAILDLHVHDTDFVHHCFGIPQAVTSSGYSKITNEIDHVLTQYDYGPEGPMVTAEGGWAMTDGFGFKMQYTVNFELATAVFDFDQDPVLTVVELGKEPVPVKLAGGMGYEREIAYFLGQIEAGQAPGRVTLEQAAQSVAIVEAEAQSIASRQSALVPIVKL